MKDPLCKQSGCYMFAAGTPERAECEKACRLSRPQNRHFTISGRLSSTRMPELQPVPSTTYDDTVGAVLRGILPKTRPYIGLVHDEVVCDFADYAGDYAALEMRVMASLMNKKEG